MASGDTPTLSGWTTGGLRAYRLENTAWVGKTVGELLQGQSRIPHRQRRARRQPLCRVADDLKLAAGDVIALGGRRETMTEKMGLIGPEVSDTRGARHSARHGRDPRHQQGRAEADATPSCARCPTSTRCSSSRSSVAASTCRSAPTPSCSAWTCVTVVGLKDAVSKVGALFGRVVRPEHGDRPADAVARHDPRLPDRRHPVPGLRRLDRPRQCRRAAGVGRDRVVDGLAAALLRQHAERGAQHPGGSRPHRLRGHRRHQCRQLAAHAAHRCAGAQDLHRRLHRLLDPAGHRLGASAITCSR